MKRIAIKLVIFLLLGAVVNVGVAWGFCLPHRDLALFLPHSQAGFTRVGEEFNDWFVSTKELFGFTHVRSDWTTGEVPKMRELDFDNGAHEALPTWATAFGRPQERMTSPRASRKPADPGNSMDKLRASLDEYVARIADASGWPCLSFWSGREVVGTAAIGNTTAERGVTITNGHLLPGEGRRNAMDYHNLRVLPLAVLWRGFLINTLFYGMVFWLLWSAPFATRRLIRKRRGHCLKCGYDLRHAEHEVCPECGAGAV